MINRVCPSCCNMSFTKSDHLDNTLNCNACGIGIVDDKNKYINDKMSNPHGAEVKESECQHDWRLNPWWEVWASDQYDCQKCKEVRYVHFTEDPDKVLGVEL